MGAVDGEIDSIKSFDSKIKGAEMFNSIELLSELINGL